MCIYCNLKEYSAIDSPRTDLNVIKPFYLPSLLILILNA